MIEFPGSFVFSLCSSFLLRTECVLTYHLFPVGNCLLQSMPLALQPSYRETYLFRVERNVFLTSVHFVLLLAFIQTSVSDLQAGLMYFGKNLEYPFCSCPPSFPSNSRHLHRRHQIRTQNNKIKKKPQFLLKNLIFHSENNGNSELLIQDLPFWYVSIDLQGRYRVDNWRQN